MNFSKLKIQFSSQQENIKIKQQISSFALRKLKNKEILTKYF